MDKQKWRSTTVCAVRRNGEIAMAADGQVTLGNTVMKGNAKKIRRIYNNSILIGFAGSTADAFNLFDKFESKVNEYRGDIVRASVELAKEWRTDKMLRKLEAMLLIADKKTILIVSGSGGNYALSAAKAYLDASDLSAREIAERALQIASDICIYTNKSIMVEEVK